jgi:hypothetical protein
MTHEITASWDTLMGQSKATAGDYFGAARRILDGSELDYTASDVIALARVMADDFRTTSMGVSTQKLCESITGIECSLDAIAEFLAEMNA